MKCLKRNKVIKVDLYKSDAVKFTIEDDAYKTTLESN